jgi:hypothetical protein
MFIKLVLHGIFLSSVKVTNFSAPTSNVVDFLGSFLHATLALWALHNGTAPFQNSLGAKSLATEPR